VYTSVQAPDREGAPGAERPGVAHRLLIGEGVPVYLDVVQHQLPEQRHAAAALEVHPEEAVDVGAAVHLLEHREVQDVEVPRLDAAIGPGEDGAFPQRHRPAAARPEPEAVLHHVAADLGAGRVGAGVELGDERLQLQPRGAERDREVVQPIGASDNSTPCTPLGPQLRSSLPKNSSASRHCALT
jgi:hypothetical protein